MTFGLLAQITRR